MTTDRIIVTALGVLLSVWVLWYFLVPPRPAVAPGAEPVKGRRRLDVVS